MISTNNIPSNFANAISPFSSQGGNPVGEESRDARNTSFKPVEESAETSRTQVRRDSEELREQRAGQVNERAGDDQQREEQRQQDARDARVAESQEAEDRREIERLSARDREVRAHEQAHRTVGGNLTGAASYTYERGPDGVSYAVAGEVSVSLGSGGGDPRETLEIARQVQRAALAPAEPSVQDRQVAARAVQIEQQALSDIAELERQEEALRNDERQLESEYLSAEDKAREEQEREEEQARAERERLERSSRDQERQSQVASQLLDLNRRLIDIGVTNPVPDAGSLISNSV